MSQINFYKFATLTLLILNIATLSFFWFTKPKNGPNQNGNNPHEQLKLNDNQELQFLNLAQEHQQLMQSYSSQQAEILQMYFSSNEADVKNQNKDGLMKKIQSLEKDKIESVNQHFSDLKSILHSSQHSDFEVFRKNALERILLSKKKRKPRPKDF